MTNIFKALGLESSGQNTLAEEVQNNLERKKSLNKELSAADLLGQLTMLQSTIRRLKKEGISVWNAKDKIPVIFDTVDGAFVIMTEVVKKLEELETKVAALEGEKK